MSQSAGLREQSSYFSGAALHARALSHLFVPDGLVPSQLDSGRPLTPHQLLRFAVLEEAMHCIQGKGLLVGVKYKRQSRRTLAALEAIEWMLAEDQTWPFSCLNICHALTIEHSVLQKWARAQRQEIENQQPIVSPPPVPQGSSRYLGVCWHIRQHRWIAKIGKCPRTHLGYFSSEEDAGRAYDAAAVRRYGARTPLNFPEVAA
jgi:hypothetical protein